MPTDQVTKVLVSRATDQLDMELGSHHGSQQGSAAASSFEGEELDEDEAAAAADFTPMTEEKRIFVNEWIAKLGEDRPDEQDPIEVNGFITQYTGFATALHNTTLYFLLVAFGRGLSVK